MANINPNEYRDLLRHFEECRPFFQAIGNETRSAIVMDLIMAGEEGHRVGVICDAVHLSRPAVSHQLKILKEAGVVQMREEGTKNYYYLCIGDHIPKLRAASEALDLFVKTYYNM